MVMVELRIYRSWDKIGEAAREAVRSEDHQALFYILEGLKAREQALEQGR